MSPQMGKTYLHVFISENVSKIVFSRITVPEKLKFTLKLPDIVQNQGCQNHGPRWSDGATIGKTVFTGVYVRKTFRIFFTGTIWPEKLKFT
jgi:hypothetical protein